MHCGKLRNGVFFAAMSPLLRDQCTYICRHVYKVLNQELVITEQGYNLLLYSMHVRTYIGSTGVLCVQCTAMTPTIYSCE